jgi:hypothetical protein
MLSLPLGALIGLLSILCMNREVLPMGQQLFEASAAERDVVTLRLPLFGAFGVL